jgi:hypothetical protein
MGLFSLIGSLFGGAGTAVGGLLDSIGGGGQQPARQQAGDAAQMLALLGSQKLELPEFVAPQPSREDMRWQLRRQATLGPGLGGGSTVNPSKMTNVFPQTANSVGGSAQPTMQLDTQVNRYIAAGLSGQTGVPENAWNQARASLAQTIKANTSQNVQQLQSQLGARGLARSGILGRATVQAQQAGANALSQGIADLRSQQLTQQANAMQNAASLYLQAKAQRQQYELALRQANVNEKQIEQARQDAMWGGIAGAVGAAANAGVFGGGIQWPYGGAPSENNI